MGQFFNEEFGFTEAESVALLGAHTLGRAMTGMSGFGGQPSGSWIDGGEERFNNKYFKIRVNSSLGWSQEDNTPCNATAPPPSLSKNRKTRQAVIRVKRQDPE